MASLDIDYSDSDEDDVCAGPLSLRDIKKAFSIMDPFRNPSTKKVINSGIIEQCGSESVARKTFINDENIINLNDTNSAENSVITLDDTIAEEFVYVDPSKQFENQNTSKTILKSCESSPISNGHDPLLSIEDIVDTVDVDNSILILDDTSDSSMLASALPISPDPLKLFPNKSNDTTTKWSGLINNLTNNLQLFDQTEPEHLLQGTLEDTVVPKNKNIKKSLDLTVIPEPEWQNESINSFETMEKLTASPIKEYHSTYNKEHYSIPNKTITNDTSYTTSAYATAQQSSLDTSTDSQSTKDIFFTAQNTSDSEAVNEHHSNTEYSISTQSNNEVHTDFANLSDSSREFDNTFDEIQYLMNLKPKSPVAQKTPEPVDSKHPYPKFSPITPTEIKLNASKSPLSAKRPRRKEFYPKDSPLKSVSTNSEFRVPKIPISSANKKPLTKSPLNFAHIVSPIGMYIKNSPRVPLIGTCTPGRSRGIVKTSLFPNDSSANKERNFKENIDNSPTLPTKAYKCSPYISTTTLKSPSVLTSLTKNDKIKKLISTTPVHEVIRHEARIKKSKLPVLKSTKPEDSFADLSVNSAEVSVYVQKEAARTETILNKKW